VAVTTTVGGLGAAAGAVYIPELEIMPTVELPPATPLTAQVTAVSVVPVTLAAYCTVDPARADESKGDRATVGAAAGAVMVTIAEPEGLLSAELTALTVTVAGLGMA